ncbi:hypothetical protein WJX72_000854 [[Myrmecia] bisecta]|uniref:Uncharacterized protein n=1 Tax=[Myrmecia] bisecta TaxID=41462 RepID=A0AAW1P2E6_9CHLO
MTNGYFTMHHKAGNSRLAAAGWARSGAVLVGLALITCGIKCIDANTAGKAVAACSQQLALYDQCGGDGVDCKGANCTDGPWPGSCCTDGTSCMSLSSTFWQCLVGPWSLDPVPSNSSAPLARRTTKPSNSSQNQPSGQASSDCSLAIPEYGQCGGQDNCPAGSGCDDSPWPGACCPLDWACIRGNAYYWQCVAGAATPQPTFSPVPSPTPASPDPPCSPGQQGCSTCTPNAMACQYCTGGHYLQDGTCIACGEGTFAFGGKASQCSPCRVEACGNCDRTNGLCYECQVGYMALQNAAGVVQCTECQAGSYAPRYAIQCTPCPGGCPTCSSPDGRCS